MKLPDRVILVTGAAKRIGRTIALRLARAGASIAVHYRRSAQAAEQTAAACRETGVAAETFAFDLDNAAQAGTLVKAVLTKFGRLDGLINNASIFERTTFDAFDYAEWERHLRVNVTAPMVLAHTAAGELRNRRGRIVNLHDAMTVRPWPDHLAYMVSKGALDTLTRGLARALAPDVTVNGVAVGVAAWPEHYDRPTRERLTRKIPLARAGSPEDVAEAVHYLLTAGEYVTGAIIPVDGGRSVC